MENISIIQVDTQKVLGIRQKGKYQLIAELLPQIFEYAMQNKVKVVGPPMFICHELTEEDVKKANETENADIEVVVPISGNPRGTDSIKCYEVKGGSMAKIIHKGAYEASKITYDKLFSWMQDKGITIIGPIREVYLTDPREVGEENNLMEIYVPIS
jgi:effector-binding domain-containing protein